MALGNVPRIANHWNSSTGLNFAPLDSSFPPMMAELTASPSTVPSLALAAIALVPVTPLSPGMLSTRTWCRESRRARRRGQPDPVAGHTPRSRNDQRQRNSRFGRRGEKGRPRAQGAQPPQGAPAAGLANTPMVRFRGPAARRSRGHAAHRCVAAFWGRRRRRTTVLATAAARASLSMSPGRSRRRRRPGRSRRAGLRSVRRFRHARAAARAARRFVGAGSLPSSLHCRHRRRRTVSAATPGTASSGSYRQGATYRPWKPRPRTNFHRRRGTR